MGEVSDIKLDRVFLPLTKAYSPIEKKRGAFRRRRKVGPEAEPSPAIEDGSIVEAIDPVDTSENLQRFSKRSDSQIFFTGNPESFEGGYYANDDALDNSEPDIKVEITYRCSRDCSFIRRNKGTYVLEGTTVVQKYNRHLEKGGSSEGSVDSGRYSGESDIFSLETLIQCFTGNRLSMGISESYMGTADLRIYNSLSGDFVNIGSRIVSLKDENGHVRHFVQDVTSGSPAEAMKFKTNDEILLLDGQLLVGQDVEKVEEMFARIQVNEEFSMLTRRLQETPDLDLNALEELKYEYFQINATIIEDVFEDPILASTSTVVTAHYQNGDIVVMTQAAVRSTFVKTDLGYWKFQEQGVIVTPGLTERDPAYFFDVLSYDAYLWKDNIPESKRVRLFRKEQDGVVYFLYMHGHGDVELLVAPHDMNVTPEKTDFNQHKCYGGDFCLGNTMLFSFDASNEGETLYLEYAHKEGRYLKVNDQSKALYLVKMKKNGSLPYQDNVRFTLILRK